MNQMRKTMYLILPDCKEASILTSQSLDESLPYRKRLGMKIHILFCKFCRRNNQQLQLVRELIRKRLASFDKIESKTGGNLSLESRKRISESIKRNITDNS